MYRRLCAVACVLGLLTNAGKVCAQGDLPLRDGAAPTLVAPTDDASQLPALRITGADVTVEALDQLAGKDWGLVALIGARFDGAIVEALRKARSIDELSLSGTRLSGQIPRLGQVNGLRSLSLGTQLTVRDLEAVGRLRALRELNLPRELALTVTGARAIAQLTNLRSLGLSGVDVDDASFAELVTLVRLTELNLSHTRVTDEGLRTLVSMPSLRRLELSRHPQGHIPQQITDACVPLLCQLTRLERLSLSGEISDTGLVEIAKLPRLTSLSLLFTRVTGAGLVALQDSHVESLTASLDQIGYLPREFVSRLNDEAALRSLQGVASLRRCARLKHVTVIGSAPAFPDIDELQRLAPGISWGFIDP